jgi:hypothetical protein
MVIYLSSSGADDQPTPKLMYPGIISQIQGIENE